MQIGEIKILMEECIATDLMGDIIDQTIETGVFITRGCSFMKKENNNILAMIWKGICYMFAFAIKTTWAIIKLGIGIK